MAYKVERESRNTVEMEVGGKVLTIRLGGMTMFRSVNNARTAILRIQKKIEAMETEGKGATAEVLELMADAIVNFFNACFGESNTNILLDFFDGNIDEMFNMVEPFIREVYVPALKKHAKEESEKKLNDIR